MFMSIFKTLQALCRFRTRKCRMRVFPVHIAQKRVAVLGQWLAAKQRWQNDRTA
jgi:hypothetical protein